MTLDQRLILNPLNTRARRPARRGLPLFSPSQAESDDTPLITAPRPVRPPLSVRRSTPDVPRVRPRPTRARSDDAELNFQADAAVAETSDAGFQASPASLPAAASRVARLAAMVIDVALLGSIDAAVIYLTLAIAGLTFTMADVAVLPVVPAAAFLLLLNGGYLVAFTVAGGQTIGKMLTGIRVTSDDGARARCRPRRPARGWLPALTAHSRPWVSPRVLLARCPRPAGPPGQDARGARRLDSSRGPGSKVRVPNFRFKVQAPRFGGVNLS